MQSTAVVSSCSIARVKKPLFLFVVDLFTTCCTTECTSRMHNVLACQDVVQLQAVQRVRSSQVRSLLYIALSHRCQSLHCSLSAAMSHSVILCLQHVFLYLDTQADSSKIFFNTHSLLRVTAVGRSALHVDRSSAAAHASSAESGVPHNLAHPCGPWPTSWAIPAVVWCVS